MSVTVAWIDVILALVLLEAIALSVWLRRRHQRFIPLLVNLTAGACLLLAVRAALSDMPGLVLAALTAALLAHLVDLRYRLR